MNDRRFHIKYIKPRKVVKGAERYFTDYDGSQYMAVYEGDNKWLLILILDGIYTICGTFEHGDYVSKQSLFNAYREWRYDLCFKKHYF